MRKRLCSKTGGILLYLILSFLAPFTSYTQVAQEWERAAGGGLGHFISTDKRGDVYVTGGAAGTDDFEDIVITKYNASGVQQWLRRYDGGVKYEDRANGMVVDDSGNVYVTGYSYISKTVLLIDYITLKYNAAGELKWSRRFQGGRGNAIAVDNKGNVYVTGSVWKDLPASDYATIKYSPTGEQLWVQQFNGASGSNLRDWASAIAVDSGGNVYVTGYSSSGSVLRDFATIKYNTDGAMQWVERYNGASYSSDEVAAIAIDQAGSVIITGTSQGIGEDYSTLKYNADGALQWVQYYNGPTNAWDNPKAVMVDSVGNIYVTGLSVTMVLTPIEGGVLQQNFGDYLTIKYDPQGVEQWVQREEGYPNGNGPSGLALDSAANVYVTGEANRIGHNPVNSEVGDYYTVKYNASGIRQWVQVLAGSGRSYDIAYSLAVDRSGNVYVTGGVVNSKVHELTTVKYRQTFTGKVVTWYRDDDGDGYGIWEDTLYADLQPAGYALKKNDCNDVNPAIHPGAAEICGNSIDDNCNGQIDEGFITTWYRDADGDGFGNPHGSVDACKQPRGYVSNNLDCDDKNKTKGGPEVCDGRDNDCDGIIDNGFDKKPFYSDWDGDGYGSPKRMKLACAAPPRYVSNSEDQNDDNPNVYPGAPELCDGRDNNQDGVIDEGFAKRTFYHDFDKDGYGREGVTLEACAAPLNYVAIAGDCNDRDASIHPGAPEIAGDGIDNNCNGHIDESLQQLITQKQLGIGGEQEVAFKLTAVPNPTTHFFILHIQSASSKAVQLRILDAVGRIVEVQQGLPATTTIPIGHNYKTGVYYAEVLQEGKRASIKLIKQ